MLLKYPKHCLEPWWLYYSACLYDKLTSCALDYVETSLRTSIYHIFPLFKNVNLATNNKLQNITSGRTGLSICHIWFTNSVDRWIQFKSSFLRRETLIALPCLLPWFNKGLDPYKRGGRRRTQQCPNFGCIYTTSSPPIGYICFPHSLDTVWKGLASDIALIL